MTDTVGKNIDKRIGSVRRRGATWRTDVHNLIVDIISHTKEHGDASRALRLVEAVPMASEKVKVILAFNTFSPINVTWNAEASKRKVGLNRPGAKAFNEYNLDGARANPYYTLGKNDDKAAEDMLAADVNERILKLSKYIQGKLDKGEVAANDREAITAKAAALRQVAAVTAAAA